MKYVRFGQELPIDKIVEIIYNTCKNNHIICKLLAETQNGQWWGVYAQDMPIRYVCLKTPKTISKFARKYGYMNSDNCVSYEKGLFGVVPMNKYIQRISSHNRKIIKSLEKTYVPGIPQRLANSGLCWYSAMCFCCFFCKQMRSIIKYYGKDDKLDSLIENCLSNPKTAETLRHYLFYKHRLGDNPEDPPEKDGQNALSEFIILCAKLGIPMYRLFAPNLSEFNIDVTDKENDTSKIVLPNPFQPSLLVVRCFRTRWKPKLSLHYKGIKYKLASVLIGSEFCGHQIGASTCDLNICKWACADADACREGISPMFWKIKKEKNESLKAFKDKWWSVWSKIIPVTLFNSNSFCDFSPHNRSSCTLEHNTKKNKPGCSDFNAGVVNSDFLYISDV